MKKPRMLRPGDKVVAVSPSWGIAGDPAILPKWERAVKEIEKFGIKIVPGENSLKGEDYLKAHPQARAQDINSAFADPTVSGIIANIGGNDSDRILPWLDKALISSNPKVFVGYSDVMNVHLYLYKLGITSFYGPNLLSNFAEYGGVHSYTAEWFKRILFTSTAPGMIPAALESTARTNDIFACDSPGRYRAETGYVLLSGRGSVCGRLLGGHTGILDYPGITAEDFAGKILFLEDIPEFFSHADLEAFAQRLGKMGALSKLQGIVIGKLCEDTDVCRHFSGFVSTVSEDFSRPDMPIFANLNFGHSSPTLTLPYGAKAKLDCGKLIFEITESSVE